MTCCLVGICKTWDIDRANLCSTRIVVGLDTGDLDVCGRCDCWL